MEVHVLVVGQSAGQLGNPRYSKELVELLDRGCLAIQGGTREMVREVDGFRQLWGTGSGRGSGSGGENGGGGGSGSHYVGSRLV
jgi:hypothetical protein